MKSPRIALIFDWLDDCGGMEHVNLAMVDAFPNAQIFTSVYDESKFPQLKNKTVHTTWLQRLPAKLRPKHQFLAPLMPLAFRGLDLSEFDIIISSSSSGYSKCIQTHYKKNMKKLRAVPEVDEFESQGGASRGKDFPLRPTHVCYCHCPVRYLYHARSDYEENYPLPAILRPFKFLLKPLLNYLTTEDQTGAFHVDHWIANSNFIGERIKTYYGSQSTTIYPGIKLDRFSLSTPNNKQDYFLALGRFIPYKRFDLLVETFAKNGLPLKLAGTGPELEKCQSRAKELKAHNIEFLGFIKNEALPRLYRNARAFLFPAEEDFGLTPIEAMACRTPVIYLAKGGAVETVADAGIPFSEQTEKSLQEAIDKFIKNEQKISSKEILERAQMFDDERFKRELKEFIGNQL